MIARANASSQLAPSLDPQAFVDTNFIIVPRWDRLHEGLIRDIFVLGKNIVVCAKSSAAACQNQNEHGVVHLRLINVLDEIPRNTMSQAVKTIRPVKCYPGNAYIFHRHIESGKFFCPHEVTLLRKSYN